MEQHQTNVCHAYLNALLAVKAGQRAYAELLSNFGMPIEKRVLYQLDQEERFLHNLMEGIWKGDVLVIHENSDQSQEAQYVLDLFFEAKELLKAQARRAEEHLSHLRERGPSADTLKYLVALYGSQVHSRNAYINGLIDYGENLGAPEIAEHWKNQQEIGKEFFRQKEIYVSAILDAEKGLDKGTEADLFEDALLIPSSILCQIHDMNQICCLAYGEFGFLDAEFSADEARKWIDAGVGAERAGYWRAYRITAVDVLEWLDRGFSDPRKAGVWNLHGFSAEEADAWAFSGFSPRQAAMYSDCGVFSPEEAMNLERWEH
ncbi:MAG: hypothetical protein KDD64_05530 [Bdellovibrionales bacterium]|nr:hypothetical protein [Bdellovibrionales bacterium]